MSQCVTASTYAPLHPTADFADGYALAHMSALRPPASRSLWQGFMKVGPGLARPDGKLVGARLPAAAPALLPLSSFPLFPAPLAKRFA